MKCRIWRTLYHNLKIFNFLKELELNKKMKEEITHIQEEKQASNHKIFWKPVNTLKIFINIMWGNKVK